MTSVGIDCRFASSTGGLGTYTRELVTALLRQPKAWQPVLFVSSLSEPWLKSLPGGVRIIPVPFAHYSLEEQRSFPAVIGRSGVSLFYSTHFNIPLRCPVPFVVTVHDLILHKYPNQAGLIKRMAYRFLFSRSVARAQHIVCVSESTRKDLIAAESSLDVGSISVVYPGVSPIFTPRSLQEQIGVRHRYTVPDRFVVYVGNAKQHKNVQMLIDAFARTDHGRCSLLLVTGGPEVPALRLTKDTHVVHGVRTDDLPAIYSSAAGFATATLYEGFGLPVIEALSCGCPVLATAVASIPEIAGDRAILVEPTLPSLVEGLTRLLTLTDRPEVDDTLRQRFDWNHSAQELCAIIGQCLV